MVWRIEIYEKPGFYDAIGESVKRDIRDLGFGRCVREVKTVQVYLIEGNINEHDIRKICDHLLIDPVTQGYAYVGAAFDESQYKVVEVAYNPGVMDPVEESAKKAISDLAITARAVKTARKYLIKGSLSYSQIHSIAGKILYNKVIQHLVTGRSTIAPEPPPYQFTPNEIRILNAGDDELKRISRDGHLFLSVDEMRSIRDYFKKIGRNPTDCELESLAQTWSEHCKHKTFRGLIEYVGENPKSEIRNPKQTRNAIRDRRPTDDERQNRGPILIDNLLKQTVMKVTAELKKPWCVSVFKDNSGVIRFDSRNNICFKVETHNHPSALEPYGGAGTGIGGCIRDPLGTGLGAKPIINTDIFCFARPDYPYNRLPAGSLHPKRVMKGVVAGVRDYGNRMGIPTSNGAVLFDDDFVGNPLVFCGNVGIMPKDKCSKRSHPGDLIVVVGGRTGRDGIHGATFSSGELTHESETLSGSAVQIGNPIQEKKLVDTIIRSRDLGLYNAITDCGAGGLSSAIGEMGEEIGAEVYLEKVPLKYKGLSYTEIWISEAQERMVLSVDPRKVDRLKDVFANEDVEATVIGKFTNSKRLKLFYNDHPVCDISMKFLHDGLPTIRRKAVWKRPVHKEPRPEKKRDLTTDLLRLLSSLNIASKEWIIRQYDHEVQGGSIIKPLQGPNEGPGDACVTQPVLGSRKGVALGCGINPDFGKIDPYWMAASAIDEALRQIVSVGGSVDRTAILDNFCWGNTNKPDRLGGLVRASWACYDIAKAYGVPFISGKDSLNNEFSTGKHTISIPPTLLISAISVIDDIGRSVTMDAKSPGNAIYLVGLTFNEMGGSQYFKMNGFIGNDVPRVDPVYGKRLMNRLTAAIQKGAVRSCHDCSDGGMAVASAEMAFAGGYGMEIRLDPSTVPPGQEDLAAHVMLFSESNTRFVVETSNERAFLRLMKGVPVWRLGTVRKDAKFRITDKFGKVIVDTDIAKLKGAWQAPFKEL
jgi:phosphoribosylformylglycinamidine synthase